MNRRARIWIAPLVAAAGVSFASCSSQPSPKCQSARGNFSATYTLVSGTGDCAMLPGDVLGVQTYNPQKSATDPTPDYNKATIAIQPNAITGLLASGPMDPNLDDVPYGIGPFSTSEPGSDGFCVAPTLSAARLRQPAVDAMPDACPPTPASPAVDVQYTFTNVRVYSTAAALGTELSAELIYLTTDSTGQTCTAQYHVRGVYPSVSCGAAAPMASGDDGGTTGDDGGGGGDDSGATGDDSGMTGDDGSAAAGDDGGGASGDDGGGAAAPDCGPPMMMTAAPGPMVANPDMCSAFANPDAGMATGSGINPDYDIVCDPNLLLCVLAKDPPSLK